MGIDDVVATLELDVLDDDRLEVLEQLRLVQFRVGNGDLSLVSSGADARAGYGVTSASSGPRG